MSQFTGRVAAITGAGSGIGRALALELASRGAKLALSDVNAEGVAETAELARAKGSPEVTHATLDVSDREAVLAHAKDVAGHFGAVHQIYNNAGIAFSGPILDSTFEDYERVLGINLWGVINGTKAFLPHLIASGAGHVVNVSSLNGFMAQPDLSHYVTAKFGVRGFTETLRLEMLAAKAPVKVSVVHPGGVATSISSNALRDELARRTDLTDEERAYAEQRDTIYRKKLLKLPAQDAAKIIADGVAKDRPRIIVGKDAKALDLFTRLAPRSYGPLVTKYFERVFAPR